MFLVLKPQEEQVWEELNIFKYLMLAYRTKLRLFSVVPSDTKRRRGNGHNLKSKKLLLNIIKNTSTLRMD